MAYRAISQHPYRAIETRHVGRIGWKINYYAELPSTQDQAAALAASGAPHGTVVIAEQQSAGRGRLGRQWYSPPGVNLYATVILRPRLASGALAQIGLGAGVAAAEALETVAPGLVAIKWPNDLWLDGKKAGGIIAEAAFEDESKACVLLGIGLNFNLTSKQIAEELRNRITSVLLATGRPCDRVTLTGTLLSRLEQRYSEIDQGDFDRVRRALEGYSALSGKRVTVANGTERQTGIVRGIDRQGALLLEIGANMLTVLAGDVTIEGAYD